MVKKISSAVKETVWKLRVEQILSAADEICAAMQSSVDQYLKIMECFSKGETASKEFETLFFDHYDLTRESRFTDFDAFRTLFADKKDLPIREIAVKLFPGASVLPRIPNCYFPSKIKHTINPNLPVMDRYLRDFFNPPTPTVMVMNIHKTTQGPLHPEGYYFDSAVEDYHSLIEWYDVHASGELAPLKEDFDHYFPDTKISTVKKIDFMISGGSKLHLFRTL